METYQAFIGQAIIESVVATIVLLLVYGAFCLFVRWLRAWKPVPKVISILAWLFYAFFTVLCASAFFSSDFFFYTLIPFVVIVPLCYMAILLYRKNHPKDGIKPNAYLGYGFFIFLFTIIIILIGLIWFGMRNLPKF